MKILSRLAPLALAVPLALAGCGEPAAQKQTPNNAKNEEAEIQAALAKLSPEDRKLAEGQKYCAVEEENRLGSMGPPLKLVIKDTPVFLCCKGCKKTAEKDADKTLARVKELKEKNAPKEAPPKK
jgi:hypothetical protein